MKYHFIYKTTNLLTDKFYVGLHSTSNLDDGYLGSGNYLLEGIKRYRIKNFKREILEFCDCREVLPDRETFWIDKLNALNPRIGMNITSGGGLPPSSLGRKFPNRKLTDEHKRKLSIAGKGRILTDEHKNKISESLKGHTISDESKLKMSNSSKRENLSKETLAKMSIANRDRIITDAHKKKISDSLKVNVVERSRNLSIALTGHIVSIETKKKLSETNKKAWKKQGKVYCPCCNRMIYRQSIRFHFDNCKLKVA